ncbi:MAG: restriction endonuclease [Dehalococcoidia bacterium]|nr:restriction endonuclease [Dehalococcoidia bacterium]
MASFVGRLQNILVSKWFAVALIALLLSCLSIFPLANASAQTCDDWNWDVWGISGIKTNYQLGETISGSISFKINNPSYCPGCVQQILVGLVDSQNRVIDVKCIYDGRPKVCPEWTIDTVNVSWENPASPGTYRLLATQDANYSCSDAKPNFRPNESYKNIATITVVVAGTTSNGEQVTEPPSPTSTPSDESKNKGPINVLDTNTVVIICFIAAVLILSISYSRSREATRKYIRFVLFLILISFVGYLFWMYGIPVISKWIRENLSTIIGVLLSLGALAIAGIAIWKNWNKTRRRIPGTREPSQTTPEPGGPTSSTIKGMRFEQKCKIILENMELNCETTKVSGDGGIDLRCHSNKPVVGGTYIVQCKDWKSSVGEPEIRDLYGTVTSERANKGILITSSYFTKAALSFAQGKNIELIDGGKLNKLISHQ